MKAIENRTFTKQCELCNLIYLGIDWLPYRTIDICSDKCFKNFVSFRKTVFWIVRQKVMFNLG